MVAAKGKLNSLAKSRVAQDQGTSNKTGGVRNFKVYAENDRVTTRSRASSNSECDYLRRKSVPVNNGIFQVNASDTKGALKNLENIKGKRESSVKINVGRRVLADISNVRDNLSRNELHDASKPVPSVGLGTRTTSSLSGKPLMGKLRANLDQAIGDYHILNRVHTKSLKASSDELKSKVQGRKLVTGRTSPRNPLPPTRKSLPSLKQVNQENAENLERGKGKSGCAVKPKVCRNVVPQVRNVRSNLSRNPVTDGFVILASKSQPKVDARASRKPIKPVLKTTVKVFDSQRTLKSKCASGLNKVTLDSAISSKRKGDVGMSSLSKHTASVVPHEQPVQEELPSESNINLVTTTSDIKSRRKSDRRKSYTSSLMAKSKLLKEHGEVTKQEILPNIYDDCNHLEVAKYVDDIYQYYWVMEAQSQSLKNYMEIQTDITPKMRGILINWLIEVHLKFDLMQETLFLMVTLLDRYLSLVSIKKSEIQLVGLTSLLLASKYEDFWHPRVLDLISISAESYTRDQMLGMEKVILKKLKFRLNAPTPYVFMLRFLKAAQSDAKFEHLAFYLIELCLVEYEALKFKPSLLCASAIYVARCTLQMTPAWTPLLTKHARYEESQIRNCAEMILRFHRSARLAMLKVTYEKYMKLDYSRVATIKPLDRIPL